MIRCLGLLALLAFLAALIPAAAPAQVTVVGAAVEQPVELRVDASGGRFTLTLRNDTAAAVVIGLPALAIAEEQAGVGDAPVVWARQTAGAGETGLGDRLQLAAGEQAVLVGTARLPAAGRYRLQLSGNPDGAAPVVQQPLILVREPAAVTATMLPQRVSWAATGVPWAWPGSLGNRDTPERRMSVLLTNTSDLPVPLPQLTASPLRKVGETGIDGRRGMPAPVIDTANCPPEIPPGGRCSIVLVLPAGLAAGKHLTALTATGGGGAATTEIEVSVRLWPALAALVVGAGIILGALVAHWREVARPRLIEELRLGQGLELLRGLTGPDLPDVVVRAAARHIRQVEDRMELRRLTDGIALPDADVLLAEARLLAEAGDALARINADPRLAAQLGGQVAALTGLIAAETMDAAAVRTALEALISARQALPEATTKGVAPEAATGVPGLPVSALLPPVGTAPSTLRRLVRRMDWRTELALLVLAGLAAIPVWGASPTWGAGFDVVQAFLAGVAVRIVAPTVAGRA